MSYDHDDYYLQWELSRWPSRRWSGCASTLLFETENVTNDVGLDFVFLIVVEFVNEFGNVLAEG